MYAAQQATSSEARLVEALVVTNLYQRQIDAVGEDILPALQALPPGDPQIGKARDWIQDWMDEASKSLSAWGDYQHELVDQFGDDRAKEIADGDPKARIQGVIDAAKARVIDAARDAGVDVSALETSERSPSSGTKTCPDCAEEVKAAARKCRFCGYRFDPSEVV
jgi:hypothetical protein